MTAPTLRSGIELSALSPGIRPQDDLFRHVNGAWLERTEIPDDKARWGSFHLIAEQAEKDVRAIIEESTTAEPGTEARKIGDLFASFMDTERIERLGASRSRPSSPAWTPSTPSRRCCARSARWSGRASAA
jgi:putative endopeptidase